MQWCYLQRRRANPCGSHTRGASGGTAPPTDSRTARSPTTARPIAAHCCSLGALPLSLSVCRTFPREVEVVSPTQHTLLGLTQQQQLNVARFLTLALSVEDPKVMENKLVVTGRIPVPVQILVPVLCTDELPVHRRARKRVRPSGAFLGIVHDHDIRSSLKIYALDGGGHQFVFALVTCSIVKRNTLSHQCWCFCTVEFGQDAIRRVVRVQVPHGKNAQLNSRRFARNGGVNRLIAREASGPICVSGMTSVNDPPHSV